MRKIIAALQLSVDSLIEGPNGELDWAMEEDEETWKDIFEMLTHVDTFILGRKMYPDYEQYWLAVLALGFTQIFDAPPGLRSRRTRIQILQHGNVL